MGGLMKQQVSNIYLLWQLQESNRSGFVGVWLLLIPAGNITDEYIRKVPGDWSTAVKVKYVFPQLDLI